MKENSIYVLGFVLLIVAMVAFSAPASMPGQGMSVETILDKLPSVVATIVLTPLALLFSRVALRAYRVWERNQRQARRQPQRQPAPAKNKQLTVNDLFRLYMSQQMNVHKSLPRDDHPRMEL